MAIDDSKIEEIFPELEFKGRLGEGGEGIVYLVLERETGAEVALKILINSDEKSVFQFLKEGRLLQEFDHPNIVNVYDYGQREEHYYILMEYCPRGSLLHLIATKKFSDKEAGLLVIKLAEALQYAHDQKVLHRDIKPENVMMGEDDEPKLVDFGLAFCAGEDVNALEAVGSEGYAAPEIWDHPERVSLQTDLYALGALLYTVLTKAFPDPHNVNFNRLFNRDQAYVRFIVKAMAKDASRRHANALQFADELHEIVRNAGRSKTPW